MWHDSRIGFLYRLVLEVQNRLKRHALVNATSYLSVNSLWGFEGEFFHFLRCLTYCEIFITGWACVGLCVGLFSFG